MTPVVSTKADQLFDEITSKIELQQDAMNNQTLLEVFAGMRGLMLDVQYQLMDPQNERNLLRASLEELEKENTNLRRGKVKITLTRWFTTKSRSIF